MSGALDTDVTFVVRTRIERAPAEVFDALVDPRALCAYFTATASGPLFPGVHVRWSWPGGDEEDVEVVEVENASRIVLRWNAAFVEERTTVAITLQPEDDGSTTVLVSESGWRVETAHLASAFEHCAGWQLMLTCLKGWLEHGIDLRG